MSYDPKRWEKWHNLGKAWYLALSGSVCAIIYILVGTLLARYFTHRVDLNTLMVRCISAPIVGLVVAYISWRSGEAKFAAYLRQPKA